MATRVQMLPWANDESEGLTPLSFSQVERELMSEPALVAWLRADSQFNESNGGWRDRKTNRLFPRFRAAKPPATLITADALYNNLHSVNFATGQSNGEMYDGGADLLPINGDYSILYYGRGADTDDTENGSIFGNGLPTGSLASYLRHNNANQLDWRHQDTTILVSSAISKLAPHFGVVSFLYNGGSSTVRFNGNFGAVTASDTAIATQNTNAELHIGATGNAGTQSAPNKNGDMSDFAVVHAAILESAYDAYRDLWFAYAQARYGL